ncbi:HEXXH motif-containing putative peptide modification protein [Streptomyces sp. NBC_01571]|uniref:aKG-HExxH-type peptide beta-hydroxylase n=1 Tax=Streptomyces sp. NBC_01571 TaxID=2975883 RepID=UPI00224EBEEF|nr:HEXXH motif-containing putative peptide modification protein [Streptomyces sp. NBC_01571]MCX4573427.1 HEXXH motif-containing putative peptide modification protein [Streptomyces sp. NBC_01571]
MNDIAAALDLDAITTHRRERTAAALTLLHPGSVPPPDDEALPLTYALAHHRLQGAENAARRRDTTTLDWYRNAAGPALARLAHSSRLGPRIVIAPNEDEMIRGPHSDTPYYLLGPDTTGAAESLAVLADDAFGHIAATGLDALVAAHAAVICLTGRRRPDQTLRSFAITRLPATVFTDHTGDAAVLGRDLVHEAAHNWLNDALAALHITIPDDETYFSPWRGTQRPAYGFLHACFAFPLTMIYAARARPGATMATTAVLADHERQQRPQLAAAQDDFTRAVKLIPDPGLRERLDTVFQHARTL